MHGTPAAQAGQLLRDVVADRGRVGGLAAEVEAGDVVAARDVVAAQDGDLLVERLVEEPEGFPARKQLGVLQLEVLQRYGRCSSHVPSLRMLHVYQRTDWLAITVQHHSRLGK